MTIPLTAPLPTRLQPPTRTCWSIRGSAGFPARGPYLALLLVGLAMPPLLPAARWALTPPFHPYPSTIYSTLHNDGRSIFCGAFRRVAPPGRYPAPFLIGVRTFLQACPPWRARKARSVFIEDKDHESAPCPTKSNTPGGHPAFRAPRAYAQAPSAVNDYCTQTLLKNEIIRPQRPPAPRCAAQARAV